MKGSQQGGARASEQQLWAGVGHIARDVHAIRGPVGGCTLREAVDLKDGSLNKELVTLRTHNTKP